MQSKPYEIGDPLSKEDVDAVLVRLVPKPADLRKARKKPMRLVKMLMTHRTTRFEHEVNRLRGWAFDSGEHGFSHERTGDT